MRRLFNKPLTWLVLAEALVVTALVGFAWYVYSAPGGPPPLLPAIARPPVEPGPRGPSGGLPVTKPKPSPASGRTVPAPGLLPPDLAGLNRDQADWERAEAGIVAALLSAARRYLDAVVLPAVERAESTSASPATTAPLTQRAAAIKKML